MAEENITCRDFIRSFSFRRKELDGFVSFYRGRRRGLPEISPKRMTREAWKALFESYLRDAAPPR
jgi:hypothetical protein